MDQTLMNEGDDYAEHENISLARAAADKLESTNQELREIELLLEQSQLEVNRLSQRNAIATGNLQRVHMHFDSLPREEIRAAYESALDAQQRLFVVRGQVEKLQSDQSKLKQEQPAAAADLNISALYNGVTFAGKQAGIPPTGRR